MKLHYLGTAAAEGWPAIFCHCANCEGARKAKGKNIRTRPQMLINEDLLMDFGPDTFYHTMRYELDLAKVSTVLLTHSHTDHFYSTELILRAYPYAYDREKNKMMLYGNEKCEAMLNRTFEVEDDSLNMQDCVGFGLAREWETFSIPGYEVTPLRASHDPAENCLIYIVRDDEGKCILYGNDTGYFPEETWEHLNSVHFDLVSLDCTMGGTPSCSGHMGLDGDFKVHERLLNMGCADADTVFVITHFSHNGGLLHEQLEQRVHEKGFIVAYDGMIIEI